MDLKWLEDFAALARAGSFSKAAAQRYVTQPTFSRRIRSLEDWAGTPLVDRATSPVQLTQAGKTLLPHALRIVSEAQSVRQDFRLVYGADHPAVRIITTHRLSVSLVPGLVARFLRENPGVLVSVTPGMESTENYGSYTEALITGVADFLITYDHESLVVDEDVAQSLECREIDREQIVPVASPAYARSIPDAWHRDASVAIDFVGYPEYSFTEKAIHPIVRRFERQLRKVYECPTTSSLRAMLLEGIGMTWLPFSVVNEDLASGRLVCLEGDGLTADIGVIVYRRGQSRGPVTESFWRQAIASGPTVTN